MSDFSLFKQMKEQAAQPTPTGPRIKYQQYDLEIEEKEVSVLIPVRECETFEEWLCECETLSSFKLKKALREFRGVLINN